MVDIAENIAQTRSTGSSATVTALADGNDFGFGSLAEIRSLSEADTATSTVPMNTTVESSAIVMAWVAGRSSASTSLVEPSAGITIADIGTEGIDTEGIGIGIGGIGIAGIDTEGIGTEGIGIGGIDTEGIGTEGIGIAGTGDIAIVVSGDTGHLSCR